MIKKSFINKIKKNMKAIRSKNMRAIRSKNTKPEIKVRKILFSKGYRFKIHDKKLPGKPDIVLPKYNTIVNIHGCYCRCLVYLISKIGPT